ncbi:MAG: hypothetical protein JO061_22830, partial [Acidobacteriaceae bacterium]|nr:hypothetical protein [Acidobacteriaceae bacterium]
MDDGNTSGHGRILIASLTLVGLAMIAATGFYYVRQRAAMEAAVSQELTAIAQIKLEQIVNWRSERVGDAHTLQASAITRTAAHLLSSPSVRSQDRADLLDTMRTLERQFLYTGAALVDRNGIIRLESDV